MRTSLLVPLLLAACAAPKARSLRPPNVLFIAADDLRPELGCLGGRALTPNLDALAGSGLLFTQHMAVVPTCGASRRAMLTGRFPSHELLGNDACLKLHDQEHRAPTWPATLRAAGWHTVCMGKISHTPSGRFRYAEDPASALRNELPEAWDEIGFDVGPWLDEERAFFGYADGSTRRRGQSPPLEEGPQGAVYPDGLLAEQAGQRLEDLARRAEPFLLAVGFFKPHLPFTAPAEHWALVAGREEGLVSRPAPPEGMPRWAVHASGELLSNYGSHPEGRRVGPEYAGELQRGYLAATQYLDEVLGPLLLKAALLEDDRPLLIVFWSDHGWHLGDRGVWGKHTLFDEALRSPLILAGDALVSNGLRVEAPVSSLDLAPTILAACRVAAPGNLDGESLLPYQQEGHQGRATAPSAWRVGPWVGSSIRNAEGRLTLWRNGEQELEEPGQAVGSDGLAGEPDQEDLAARLRSLIWPLR